MPALQIFSQRSNSDFTIWASGVSRRIKYRLLIYRKRRTRCLQFPSRPPPAKFMAGSLAQSSIVEQGGLATVVRRPDRSLAGTSPIPVSMGRSSGPPYRCLPSQAARTAGCLAPDHFSTIPQQSQRGGAAGRQRATRKTPDARFQLDLCLWSRTALALDLLDELGQNRVLGGCFREDEFGRR